METSVSLNAEKTETNEVENLIKMAGIFNQIIIFSGFFGAFVELVVLIFLLFNFKNKQSIFSSSYFHLLSLGYFLELICFIPLIFKTIFSYSDTPFTIYISKVCDTYIIAFIGPWNISLCLNRFSSVYLDNKHQSLWASKKFYLLLIFLVIYPLILFGYSFLNIECKSVVASDQCYDYVEQNFLIGTISNAIASVFSLILGIATFVIFSRKNKRFSNGILKPLQTKIERNLLLQSFISSIFYVNFVFTMAAYPYLFSHRENSPTNFSYFIVLVFLQNVFYMSFHYSSFILLLFFSQTLRIKILKFYHLNNLFSCKIRIRPTVSNVLFLANK